MNDVTTKNLLTLNENDQEGTVILPGHHQLALKYTYKKKMPVESPAGAKKGRKGADNSIVKLDKKPYDICRRLVLVLGKIKRMSKYKRRSRLLSRFDDWALEGIDRDESDMVVDLGNIIDHVAYLERLEDLIEEAKVLAHNSPTISNELDRICQKYQDFKRRIDSESERFPPEPSHYIYPSGFDPDFRSDFDVFLAHNSQDKPLVESIAEKLKQRGLNPWLDKEQIPPGRWFQDIIQQAIPTVKSAAIFIGPKGLGKWQLMELRAFTSRCVETNLPVIPVLLPGVNDIPEDLHFLKELNWVRFSSGIDDLDALDNLEWGITGKHPRKS